MKPNKENTFLDLSKLSDEQQRKVIEVLPNTEKPKYNEPTETIAFRVPKSHKESVKNIVDDYLKPLTANQIKKTRCYVNMDHSKREMFLKVVMSVDENKLK